MQKISEKELNDWLKTQHISILFFKNKKCGICTTQLPKIKSIAQEHNLSLKIIDLSENMHLSSAQMVLNIPVTKVFHNGKEIFKEGAYLSFDRLKKTISDAIEAGN